MIVVVALLLVSVLTYYFFILQPLKQDVAEKENELAFEEEILASIESSQETADSYEDHEIHELLRTVPVHPWVDHWMLDMEKAELISGAEIFRYTFSKDLLLSTVFTLPEEEVPEDGTEETEEVVVDEDVVVMDSPEDTVVLDEEINPTEDLEDSTIILGDNEEVNQVTASLSVQAETYEQLFQFLHELEQLDRLTEIYGLSFTAPSESDMLLDEEESESPELLTFEVNVSTYYIDDLVDTFGDYETARPFIQPELKETPIYQNP